MHGRGGEGGEKGFRKPAEKERESISTIGKGGDTTIPSPGRSSKQPLPGIELYDPLHGRRACPEFNSFHQVVDKIRPREGLFSCHPLPKREQICDIPATPKSFNDSRCKRLTRLRSHLGYPQEA